MAPHDTFCMAMASTVLQVQLEPNSSSITVFATSWDPSSSSFSKPVQRRIPFSGDAEILAAGVVHNYALGESVPHLVIRKESRILIGCFDAEKLDFDALVETEMPTDRQLNQSINSRLVVEGCWLVDGPVFVAQAGGKILIIHNLTYVKSDFSRGQANESIWSANMLSLEGLGGRDSLRVLYCGELEAFAEAEVLISFQVSTRDNIPQMPYQRLRKGWNFLRMSVNNLEFMDVGECHQQDTSWHQLMIQDYSKVANNLFPDDTCTDLISCIGIILKDPASVYAEDGFEVSCHDIVAGFWNGKVAKYRTGKTIAQNELEDAPMSLQYAVVSGGRGIILLVLSGDLGKVLALCAETLQILKAWSALQDVLIGDFQLLGHDQLLLLSSALGTVSVNKYLMPQQLTDITHCYFSHSEQTITSDVSATASELHKIKTLSAVIQCLQSRVKAGLLQIRHLEEQRTTKAELVQSSCRLLQDMILKHEVLKGFSGESNPDYVIKAVHAKIRQQGICGRTWFLLVDIQNTSEENLVFFDLHLSLSTVRGPISGTSSVIESITTVDTVKYLIASGPTSDFPDISTSQVLHVFLGLQVSEINGDVRKDVKNMYKVWVGEVKHVDILANGYNPPMAVPLEFREVAPECNFIIRRNMSLEIVDLIKDTLKMEDRVHIAKSKYDIRHELVANQSGLWSDATIVSLGKACIVILRAEDSNHLSTLKTCLWTQLKNQLHVSIDVVAYPNILEAIHSFLSSFKEELSHRRSMLLERVMEKVEGEDIEDMLMSNLQMSTDMRFASLLSMINSSHMLTG